MVCGKKYEIDLLNMKYCCEGKEGRIERKVTTAAQSRMLLYIFFTLLG